VTIVKSFREDFLKLIFQENTNYELSLHFANPAQTGLNEASNDVRKNVSFTYGNLNGNLQLQSNDPCVFINSLSFTTTINWFCIWKGIDLLWRQSISPSINWQPNSKLILSNIKIRY
jgi:hypothetical protein